jgi:hypothetical protein
MEHHTSYEGPWGDFQWFTVSAGTLDNIVSDVGVITDISAIEPAAGLSVNESVCAYGLSSNDADCSLDIAVVNVNCSPTPGRQVRMDGDTQVPGDSGGPWYVGGRAYGLHRGGCAPNGNDHFSVADYLDEALIVKVETTN